MLYFDLNGFLTENVDPARCTSVPLPQENLAPGARWSFTGYAWVAYKEPEPPTLPQIGSSIAEQLWWIDVGPFIDRLGFDAPAIGAGSNEACKGVMAMLTGRKYIDLKEPKTALMLDILIAAQQPTASPFFPGSGPMTAAKKAAILDTPTTDKERHIKGLI